MPTVNSKYDNKTIYTFIAIIIMLLLIIFLALYYFEINYTKEESIQETKIVNVNENEDENDYEVKITAFEIEENIINVAGYVYDYSPEFKKFDTYFVLKNNSNNKFYKLNTIMKRVEGLEDETIANRGIFSRTHITFLPKGNYDLFIKYNNNDKNVLLQTEINFELE